MAKIEITKNYGIKTVVTTLPNGKKTYRTILTKAKNAGNAGTIFRRRELGAA